MTWSKLVKYGIFTFVLRCYYIAARFSLRHTRFLLRIHLVRTRSDTFLIRSPRAYHVLTASLQSLQTIHWSLYTCIYIQLSLSCWTAVCRVHAMFIQQVQMALYVLIKQNKKKKHKKTKNKTKNKKNKLQL